MAVCGKELVVMRQNICRIKINGIRSALCYTRQSELRTGYRCVAVALRLRLTDGNGEDLVYGRNNGTFCGYIIVCLIQGNPSVFNIQSCLREALVTGNARILLQAVCAVRKILKYEVTLCRYPFDRAAGFGKLLTVLLRHVDLFQRNRSRQDHLSAGNRLCIRFCTVAGVCNLTQLQEVIDLAEGHRGFHLVAKRKGHLVIGNLHVYAGICSPCRHFIDVLDGQRGIFCRFTHTDLRVITRLAEIIHQVAAADFVFGNAFGALECIPISAPVFAFGLNDFKILTRTFVQSQDKVRIFSEALNSRLEICIVSLESVPDPLRNRICLCNDFANCR